MNNIDKVRELNRQMDEDIAQQLQQELMKGLLVDSMD